IQRRCQTPLQAAPIYNKPRLYGPRCSMQKGYCLAIAFNRITVSSSGGSTLIFSTCKLFD
ncbi:MAG TPA: hypothetical protein VN616_06125, partial [Puia sp.]|nr:hypothetical protein [Puia sp.]